MRELKAYILNLPCQSHVLSSATKRIAAPGGRLISIVQALLTAEHCCVVSLRDEPSAASQPIWRCFATWEV